MDLRYNPLDRTRMAAKRRAIVTTLTYSAMRYTLSRRTGKASNLPSSIRSGLNSSACEFIREPSQQDGPGAKTHVFAPHLGVPVNHVDTASDRHVFLQQILSVPNEGVLVRTRGTQGRSRSEAKALSHDRYGWYVRHRREPQKSTKYQ